MRSRKQRGPQNSHAHRLWLRLRRPSVLPTWAVHQHEWETYDSTCAGCLLCGAEHACSEHACAFVECDDGGRVCPITAYCLPSVHTAVDEFVYRHQHQADADCTRPDRRHSTLREAVEVHVRFALTGDSIQLALARETAQLLSQREQVFLRVCRAHKLQLQAGQAPRVTELFAALVYETRHMRVPLLPAQSMLEDLCATCSSAIAQFLVLIHATKSAQSSVGDAKLRQVIVGLLYMMRHGIRCNDTVLLPQIAMLRSVLPLESNIELAFQLRSKTITETENMVKMAIRQLSHQQLKDHAAAQTSC